MLGATARDAWRRLGDVVGMSGIQVTCLVLFSGKEIDVDFKEGGS